MINLKELREKKIEELREMEKELRSEISDEYFSMRMGQKEDVREPRKMRKDLARLLTVIKEKEKNKIKKDQNDE